jgi:hypothetical protein
VVALTSLNRWKAAAIHLGISAAIGISVVALMLALWYPQHYFAAMGGDTLIMLLIGVDVVIGPLITLIIFDPKKKNLRFDLAVIALLQSAALAYGCGVMFKARPVYNVFVVDRFEVIAANAVDDESREKAKPDFRGLSLTGPKLAGALEPTDPKRQLDIVMSAAGGGNDLSNFPDLFVPYDDVKARAGQAARPLAELVRHQPQDAPVVRSFVAASGRAEDAMGYLPMKARNRDMAVVVDRKTGDVVGIVPVNPW